jgi:hypothetical protein
MAGAELAGSTAPAIATRGHHYDQRPEDHLLLQTRTRTLDGTLRPLFERWYPGLANDNEDGAAQAVAA